MTINIKGNCYRVKEKVKGGLVKGKKGTTLMNNFKEWVNFQ